MHHCLNVISWAKLGFPTAFFVAHLLLVNAAIGETCGEATGASREGIIICDLGVLEGGGASFANAVSEDGKTVVGKSNSSVGERAFKWTKADGMIDLGTLPGGSESQARGVSSDGKVIVGSSDTTNGQRAFLWMEGTGMISLGDMEGNLPSSADAVSADGSIVVGFIGDSRNRSAFRWSAETGMTKIGTEAFDSNSVALGVSDDGAVIVGRVGFLAFRWTDETGIVLLEPEKSSVAFDASGDGKIIVGSAGLKYSKRTAVKWMENDEGQDVNPSLNEARSDALDISSDGMFIVGTIDKWTAFLRKRGEEPIILGGLAREDADFAGNKAVESGAGGSVVVGSSTGADGNRAVRWLLPD